MWRTSLARDDDCHQQPAPREHEATDHFLVTGQRCGQPAFAHTSLASFLNRPDCSSSNCLKSMTRSPSRANSDSIASSQPSGKYLLRIIRSKQHRTPVIYFSYFSTNFFTSFSLRWLCGNNDVADKFRFYISPLWLRPKATL